MRKLSNITRGYVMERIEKEFKERAKKEGRAPTSISRSTFIKLTERLHLPTGMRAPGGWWIYTQEELNEVVTGVLKSYGFNLETKEELKGVAKRVFIPQIKTVLKLREEWKVYIINEEINKGTIDTLGLDIDLSNQESGIYIKFPIDTLLSVERYELTKNKGFVEFKINSSPLNQNLKGQSIWVKVSDVNNIAAFIV